MDKRIVEALAKKGIISKININPDKYESVDDLFKKGVISKPGVRSMVDKILAELNLIAEKPTTDVIVPETDVVDTPADAVVVVDEVVIEEVDEADVPADAEAVDEIVVDEVELPVAEETKSSKKGGKKSE